LRSETEKANAESNRKASRTLAEAEQKAEQIVAEAVARAGRIRSESERELAAATQRRDSINAQLTNVRQMLATLSGTSSTNVELDEPKVEQPPAQAAPQAQSQPGAQSQPAAQNKPAPDKQPTNKPK
jgi:regulator of protease activity HflC (stomatin/prohibitin superfamily)